MFLVACCRFSFSNYPDESLMPKTPSTPATAIVVLDSSPPGRSAHRRGIKILPTKQVLQKLLILLAQVQAGITSEILLNKIRQVVYSLYWQNKFQKKYTTIY